MEPAAKDRHRESSPSGMAPAKVPRTDPTTKGKPHITDKRSTLLRANPPWSSGKAMAIPPGTLCKAIRPALSQA